MAIPRNTKPSTKPRVDVQIDEVIRDLYLEAARAPLPANLVALVRELAAKTD